MPTGEQAAFRLSNFDVAEHRIVGGLVDDRSHGGVGDGIADLDGLDAFANAFDKEVVNILLDDGAGAGRAFLPAESEGRGDDCIDCGVDIGVCANDDGIFTTHFEDGALDPDLAGLCLRGAGVNFKAYALRSSERDEAGAGDASTMALPKLAPEPGQKFTTPGGMPASSSTSTKRRGDGGRVARRLKHDSVAADDGGGGHVRP